MKQMNYSRILFFVLTFLLAIVVLSPFYFVLANSVKSYSEIILDAAAMPQEIALSNYQEGIEKVNFWQIFFNSALVTVLGIGGMVLFGSMAAWKLARVKSRVSMFMYATYILAMIIPFQSIMIPLVVVSSTFNMLHPIGLGVIYWGFGMPLTIFPLSQGSLNNL